MFPHHQRGDDFVGHLLDGDHVSAGLRVDDALLLLPAHHDGLLAVSNAAHPLLLALRGQRGVGVGGDHGRDCTEGEKIRICQKKLPHLPPTPLWELVSWRHVRNATRSPSPSPPTYAEKAPSLLSSLTITTSI